MAIRARHLADVERVRGYLPDLRALLLVTVEAHGRLLDLDQHRICCVVNLVAIGAHHVIGLMLAARPMLTQPGHVTGQADFGLRLGVGSRIAGRAVFGTEYDVRRRTLALAAIGIAGKMIRACAVTGPAAWRSDRKSVV